MPETANRESTLKDRLDIFEHVSRNPQWQHLVDQTLPRLICPIPRMKKLFSQPGQRNRESMYPLIAQIANQMTATVEAIADNRYLMRTMPTVPTTGRYRIRPPQRIRFRQRYSCHGELRLFVIRNPIMAPYRSHKRLRRSHHSAYRSR